MFFESEHIVNRVQTLTTYHDENVQTTQYTLSTYFKLLQHVKNYDYITLNPY